MDTTDISSDATPAAGDGEHRRTSFLKEWRWWIAPALLTLALALLFIDPFAGDWDSLDYTVLALAGEPSSMILGRMLFIFANSALFHLAHALFGLQPENAYLLFKYTVVAQSPLATAVFWKLARDLTGSSRSATAAAFLLAFSPYYVIYSGQAMTEIPSILLLSIALVVHLRGLRERRIWAVLLGAFLLGAGVNLREGVALYGLWLAFAPFACGWGFTRRELFVTTLACVVFFICALGPFALYYSMDVNNYAAKWHEWAESSRRESALHPVSLGNFRTLMLWFFIAAPLALVALPLAMFREWRTRGWSPLLLMAGVGLFSNLSLIIHYSTVVNGRYLLTGLPGVIPLVGDFLLRHETTKANRERRALRRAVAGVVLTGLVFGCFMYKVAWPSIQSHALTGEYRAQLETLPDDAVVLAGWQTVAVSFWRGVGAGNWDWIGTGSGWPGNDRIVAVIEHYLRTGRRVFLDTNPRLWAASGWQADETRAIVGLESHFNFRRHSGTIYEIRPPDDTTATDTPDLRTLMPGSSKQSDTDAEHLAPAKGTS